MISKNLTDIFRLCLTTIKHIDPRLLRVPCCVLINVVCLQLARILRDPIPIDMQTVLEQRVTRSTDVERHITSFIDYTTKKQINSWGVDMDKDDERKKLRNDYIHFTGKHEVNIELFTLYVTCYCN